MIAQIAGMMRWQYWGSLGTSDVPRDRTAAMRISTIWLTWGVRLLCISFHSDQMLERFEIRAF